ncbi:sugar ABC transporter permease [Desulfopila aestuarii]|uniref:Xylose transport system permease protein XylH n=1 Tax=Desulfopila aestuarii DSM 18488 TaxID=1121416 RepID=A0A1M7Y5M7_9BACT|nr:sugar ABC transporter permease [Desulfopila aestuarii]SHO47856.1 xylose ABC transporter membrane protein [Desulfopila aestuarii DSM 18488]
MVSKTLSNIIRNNLQTYTMILALVFIWLLFGFMTDWIFFSPRNLSNLFRQMTIVSFLSIGMVMVIVTGNIDLSVGSSVGLVSAVTAWLQAIFLPPLLQQWFPGISMLAQGTFITCTTILFGLVVGGLIGVIQGWAIAYLGIPAFIVTLGGMLVFRGGVLGITQGKTIVPIEDSFRLIAQGYLPNSLGYAVGFLSVGALFFWLFYNRKQKASYGITLRPFGVDLAQTLLFSGIIMAFVYLMNSYRGIPNPVLLMVVVALIFTYITGNTRLGRYAYALGGNAEATRLSGVNTKANVFQVFVLMGLLAGVSGIVLTGYVAAGTTSGGVNYELEAIAACVIGGTSLMGGSGSIAGALVGSLIMASLLNGMSVMNMPAFWQFIIRGLVLVLAVYMDVVTKKRRG